MQSTNTPTPQLSASTFTSMAAATTSVLATTTSAFLMPVPTSVIAASAPIATISGAAVAAGVLGSAIAVGGAVFAGYKLAQYCQPVTKVTPAPEPEHIYVTNYGVEHIYDTIPEIELRRKTLSLETLV